MTTTTTNPVAALIEAWRDDAERYAAAWQRMSNIHAPTRMEREVMARMKAKHLMCLTHALALENALKIQEAGQ